MLEWHFPDGISVCVSKTDVIDTRPPLDSRVNPNTEDPMGRRTELIARPIPLMARCRPTASSLPPCSWTSRRGLAMSVYLARSERRPALTSTARVGVQAERAGAKKRALRPNKETDHAHKPVDFERTI